MKIEYLSNPFEIGLAISAVGPKNQETRALLKMGNTQTWFRKPHLPEWALVNIYFGLDEKKGKFDQKDTSNIATILRWILSLKKEDYDKNQPPSFLDNNYKRELMMHITNLGNGNRPDETSFNAFLIGNIINLEDAGVFNGKDIFGYDE